MEIESQEMLLEKCKISGN